MSRVIDALHRAGAEVVHDRNVAGARLGARVAGRAEVHAQPGVAGVVRARARRVSPPRASRAAGATRSVSTRITCSSARTATSSSSATTAPRSSGARCRPATCTSTASSATSATACCATGACFPKKASSSSSSRSTRATGEIVTGPEIVTRGWVYAPEAEDLLEDAKQVVRDVDRRRPPREGATDFETMRRHARRRSAASSTSAPAAGPSSSRSSWKSDGVRRPWLDSTSISRAAPRW